MLSAYGTVDGVLLWATAGVIGGPVTLAENTGFAPTVDGSVLAIDLTGGGMGWESARLRVTDAELAIAGGLRSPARRRGT